MSGFAPSSEGQEDSAPMWGEEPASEPEEDVSVWDNPSADWGAPAAPEDGWGAEDTQPRLEWPAAEQPGQQTWAPEPEPTAWDAAPPEARQPTPMAPPSNRPSAPSTPEPTLDHSASALIRNIPEPGEPKARQGWRSWFGLPPGPQERAERADMAKVQLPLVGAKTVVVLNPKGGAGKTPISLTLAGALGSARGGSVVAVDNNELRGTMPLRTLTNGCRENVRTFVDNIDRLRNSMSTAEIQRYMRHQGDGQYDALVCATDARHEVTAEEYDAIHEVLSRVYQLTVVDTGNNEGAANWKAALGSADAIVVPMKRSSSSTCVAASQMLEELQKTHGDLVRNAIIVFTDGPGPVNKEEYQRHLDYFRQRARTVIEMPTDNHIASESPIEHNRLKAKTKRAALSLAAAVSDVLSEPF